ncbi:MAG: MFS transporter [Betaproteobacteria bacterium]|nr:MFS transporter [Betaproteobacteria bacterium]
MNRPYYGWIVVAAAFTLMFIGFGAAYSFAAFFAAFQSEFSASRANVSLVFSVAAFLWFTLGAPGGMLADRIGPRRVCLVGVACLVLAPLLASAAHSIEVLYLTYSVGIGIGVGLTYVPSVGAVQPWFVQNRAFASGIAVAGIGAGNFLVPLVATWIIGLVGWRAAYQLLAVAVLVLAGAAALAIDDDPARHGAKGAARTDRASLPGATLGEALRTEPFWLLYLSSVLVCVGLFVPMVHLASYAQDAGYTQAQGVALVSLIGLGSLLGRFTIGGIADRIGRQPSLALMYIGLGLMLVLWWLTSTYWVLVLFALLFGTFYGGFVALAPTIIMDLYGPRAVSGIIGVLYTGPGLGTLVGPPLAGAAFDAFGSYDAPILTAAGLSFAGAALVWAFIRSARRRAAK